MPYIQPQARERLRFDIPRTAGELNYQISLMIYHYWCNNGQNYQAFNDIIGAMEGAKMELYRRKVAPYEDKKIEENGDVYNVRN